jgi:hypothetical protein
MVANVKDPLQRLICFLAKNRQKATLPPKSGENGLFFEKEIAKIETVFKLFEKCRHMAACARQF